MSISALGLLAWFGVTLGAVFLNGAMPFDFVGDGSIAEALGLFVVGAAVWLVVVWLASVVMLRGRLRA